MLCPRDRGRCTDGDVVALTVTVMFTDLVDSTALMSRVGEEVAEELRREHFSLLRESFGSVGGQEVKNLGDGLMVVFPSAADAVAGAVAAQQAFEHRNRRTAQPMSIRVGIAVGDADVDDGDYFGVPVIQAARLCASAAGDEILMSTTIRLLAGARGGFAFESVGDLELKGLDEPVPACRVRWEPSSGMRSPLPPRLMSASATTFVGRAAEYEQLQAAWKETSSQAERRVVLVSGEPGIGKTTLTARFAGEVHAEGSMVVYGRCDEDLGIPYQPWVEALRDVVAHAPEAVLAGHVEGAGAHLARLVPDLATRLGVPVPAGGEAEKERFVLFGCVADLLERLTGDEPVLLVLDDLHWADRQSVQLLRHVITCGRPMRLVVLGTFRDSDVTAADPMTELLAALHREQGVERLGLKGLGDGDLLEMLERIAGHEMTEEGLALRDAVLDETAGNPFFVGEILRHLAETGAIYQDESSHWVGAIDLRSAGLPVSVKEVVGRRLAGLGPDAERTLSFAAMIGRDFDVTLLAQVAGTDEDAVIDVCDAAVAAAVLTTTDHPDRYSFSHAVIAHTLYDGLSPARRARAHRAVAEHLELLVGDDPGDRVGELAHHWIAATAPADAGKAVHYAAAAGARALEAFAPDEALRWYGQARDLLERHPGADRQRVEVLVGLGDAQRQCGVAEHRETLLEAARLADRIDAIDLLVHAALTNSRGFASIIGSTDDERLRVIERALERLGDTDLALRARLLALAVAERTYVDDFRDRLALACEAVHTARRSGSQQALILTLAHAGPAAAGPSALGQRIEWVDELYRMAEESRDPTLLFRAADQRRFAALIEGDLATFRRCVARMHDLIDRVPAAFWHWVDLYTGTVVPAVLAGALDVAEGVAGDAWVFGEQTGQLDASTIFGAQIASIRHHQGRLHELVPQIEQTIADRPGLLAYRAVLAQACARGGDLRRAGRLLDVDRAGGLAMPEDHVWSTAHAAWADAAYLVDDMATAAQLHDRMRPYHREIVTADAIVHCTFAHYLGMLDHVLGRHDEAERWFEEAAAIHESMESPLLVGYTEAAWAALLADRNRGDDHQRARAMAERAAAVASANGYGYIQTDAEAVMAKTPRT
jgi:class 3 adenylate cyclase